MKTKNFQRNLEKEFFLPVHKFRSEKKRNDRSLV